MSISRKTTARVMTVGSAKVSRLGRQQQYCPVNCHDGMPYQNTLKA
ncbi:hypothetical protein [Iningainema tapete]|nr:hypothetical protein [Iningainema tapete]